MKHSSRNVGNDRLVSETFGCKFLVLAIGDGATAGNGRKAIINGVHVHFEQLWQASLLHSATETDSDMLLLNWNWLYMADPQVRLSR